MVINKEKCIGCGQCIPYCGPKAIRIENRQAYIDLDLCVECGNCKFGNVCPVDAIVQQTLIMPRMIRAIFSNAREKSPNTGIPGRGTEEMKTNDITNRYPLGKVGIACEMGRPATSTSFHDVETIARTLCAHGAQLEQENPSAIVFEPGNTGSVKAEFKNERAMSFIIEALIDADKLPAILSDLKEAQKQVDTVFSVDVITRMDHGMIPTDSLLSQAGVQRRPNGKTCVGLGKARKGN
ncbi:MAG: 4Fe-4S binding protein [Oscillospiraceae bacterium]|nr:4Fe-4S binding protein [Oscillospiraceae bacterium]